MPRAFQRFWSVLLVVGLLFMPAVPSNASILQVEDNDAPVLVDLTLNKSVLKPGEIGTYTVRFRDENPGTDQQYLSWLVPVPTFNWSYITTKELHNGRMVPGSLSTNNDGVTSFQIQFRVLEDAPYGRYDGNTSIVLEDAKGNYVSVGLPPFTIDDPEHPIDNVPTITGEPIVGQTLAGSINAPGAKVELAWLRETSRDLVDAGKGSEIFAPPEWYGLNLKLIATATWPDGHTLVRHEYSGYLQGMEVDLGTMVFDSQPTVGKPFNVIFTPNPKLPFVLPWSEVRLSYSGEQHRLANGYYLPFPSSAGKPVRASLSYRLPTGYFAASEPEVAAIMAPGSLDLSPPKIDGTAAVGKTLTANSGTWAGSPDTYTYQWLRNGTPINMEAFPDYEVVPADVGTSLTVKVSAHWNTMSESPSTVSTAIKPILGSQPTTQLRVNGTFAVGKAVAVAGGGWLENSKLTYQWLREGKVITGATKPAYALVAMDQGKKVSVKITATKPGYKTTTKSSSGATVAAGSMVQGKVVLSGTSKVGNKLTAKSSGWTAGSKLTYQWLRNGKVIASSTKSTYKLSLVDRRNKVSVRVRASKTGYESTGFSTSKQVSVK
ncbi:hypothetical protein CGQ24_02205 [Arthrobacter sp. 7749]|nr:hypothetical protein CGQ24_02205 [Arthrobacter sp. 7749]